MPESIDLSTQSPEDWETEARQALKTLGPAGAVAYLEAQGMSREEAEILIRALGGRLPSSREEDHLRSPWKKVKRRRRKISARARAFFYLFILASELWDMADHDWTLKYVLVRLAVLFVIAVPLEIMSRLREESDDTQDTQGVDGQPPISIG